MGIYLTNWNGHVWIHRIGWFSEWGWGSHHTEPWPSQAATWPTKDIYHQDSVARENPAVLRGEDTNKSGEFIVTSQKLTTNDGERSILNGKIIHHSYTSRCGIEEGLF